MHRRNKKAIFFFILGIFLAIGLFFYFKTDKKSEEKKETSQTDFVELLKNENPSNKPIKANILSDRNFRVYIPISDEEYIGYYFEKNPNDDFIVFASAVSGNFNGETFNENQYLTAGSNKEFALRVRPIGSVNEYKWFPEHESTGTAFALSQSILFDGVEKVDIKTEDITDVKMITLVQSSELIYPGEIEASAIINMETTIDQEGVSYTGEIEWLRDTEIEKGYVTMFPAVNPPFDTLRTSVGNDYDATIFSGNTNLVEEDAADSYAFFNKNNEPSKGSYVLAQSIIDSEKTFRKGQDGRKKAGILWMEHRNNGELQKLYPQIYQNYIAEKGEKINFGATLYGGILKSADELLK